LNSKLKSIFLATITLFITLSLIIFPEESLHASIRGLHTWGEIVFPSLLPFFITAELLIGFGVVQFIGVLFEPIMRPIFNIPGVGSFAWILGMASGFPSGAKISASLREKNAISRVEAERLVSFSNASSPLFIFGAIAVGFFHHAQLGLFIAICHYVSNAIVGICMRFYGRAQTNQQVLASEKYSRILFKAFQKMHQTRMEDERPFGQILGDAVISSIQTLIMVGGFIMLFSVFTTLLHVVNVVKIIQFFLTPVLALLHIPPDIILPSFTGIFEISMGTEMISKLTSIPLVIQLALVNIILGFNGFSIHAQVASILAKTDIRFFPYFFARILHAIIACLLSLLLYNVYFKQVLTIEDVFSHQTILQTRHILEYLTKIGPTFTISCLFIAISILLHRQVKK